MRMPISCIELLTFGQYLAYCPIAPYPLRNKLIIVGYLFFGMMLWDSKQNMSRAFAQPECRFVVKGFKKV